MTGIITTRDTVRLSDGGPLRDWTYIATVFIDELPSFAP